VERPRIRTLRTECLTGKEAAPPDIVVVTVCLEGGREGIEVGWWMREIFEVPVVFVTSYSDDDTVARIRALVPGALCQCRRATTAMTVDRTAANIAPAAMMRATSAVVFRYARGKQANAAVVVHAKV
jgi:DNA-binding NarL/FixJ family response regulator